MDNRSLSQEQEKIHSPQGTESPSAPGCSFASLMAVIWIGGVVGISQAVIWFIEQGVVEGSIRGDPGRWIISLAAGLAIAIPFGLLTKTRHAVYRQIFKTWALGGLVMVLLVPTRLLSITDSQGVAGLQLAGLMIFNLALKVHQRRQVAPTQSNQRKPEMVWWLSALSVSGLLALVWAATGALGSWLDTLLGLAVGLAAGCAAYLALNVGLFRLPGFIQPGQNFFKGVVIAQLLVMFSAALGVNGNEWVLLMAVPILGWMAAFWFRPGRGLLNGFVWLVGLAFAWPLIWVDADELSLVITSGTGELWDWVGSASIIALTAGLILTLTLFLVRRWLKRRIGAPAMGVSLAVVIGVLAVVLITRGTPGFYGEKLFVILKDQADLSAIPDTMAYSQRREEVYRRLVAHAETSQAGLRRDLSTLGIPHTPYYLVNAIEVDAGPVVRLWLSLNPAVDRILDNPVLRPLPEPIPQVSHPELPPTSLLWNLRLIQADRVWEELNVRGEGIIVGQSDSGAQGTHPEVAEQFRGAVGGGQNAWYDPWFGSQAPVDIGGHGTHTLGTILGKSVGVAPEAEWIGCVNLARNLGNPGLYLGCMQFMLAPFPHGGDPFRDGVPSAGANVLNNSWGCPAVEGCDTASLAPAVAALRKAGVFVVASAGNSGLSGCGSIDAPLALYDDVYTVGAIDRNGNRADFSSLGPVEADGSQRIKPDIMAPGQGVFSAYPGNGYNTLGGTSMAGPHVVGVVALMWSANPDLIGKIDQTTQILNQTAKPYTGINMNCDSGNNRIPSNVSGYGVVDAYAAVQAALDLKPQTELR